MVMDRTTLYVRASRDERYWKGSSVVVLVEGGGVVMHCGQLKLLFLETPKRPLPLFLWTGMRRAASFELRQHFRTCYIHYKMWLQDKKRRSFVSFWASKRPVIVWCEKESVANSKNVQWKSLKEDRAVTVCLNNNGGGGGTTWHQYLKSYLQRDSSCSKLTTNVIVTLQDLTGEFVGTWCGCVLIILNKGCLLGYCCFKYVPTTGAPMRM
jgi:hypothetical protein